MARRTNRVTVDGSLAVRRESSPIAMPSDRPSASRMRAVASRRWSASASRRSPSAIWVSMPSSSDSGRYAMVALILQLAFPGRHQARARRPSSGDGGRPLGTAVPCPRRSPRSPRRPGARRAGGRGRSARGVRRGGRAPAPRRGGGRGSGRRRGSSRGGGRRRSWSRPRRSVASASWMRTSVSVSTEAVASSSTRIAGSRTSARANATSWRSPSERLPPRSRISSSRPARQPRDEAVGPHGAQRAVDALARDRRVAQADVLEQRAREEEDVLEHDADAGAQRARRVVAHVAAVDEDAPARHVVLPRDQVDDARLPGAGRPDERRRRARPAPRTRCPSGRARPRRRRSARPRTRRGPRARRPRPRPARRGTCRLGVHELEDALGGDQRLEQAVEVLGEVAQRLEEEVDEQGELEELARRDAAVARSGGRRSAPRARSRPPGGSPPRGRRTRSRTRGLVGLEQPLRVAGVAGSRDRSARPKSRVTRRPPIDSWT